MSVIDNFNVSYSDLERAGWPQFIIDDYQSFKRSIQPQYGTEADPNGIYAANLNGQYFDIATPAMWVNPIAGALEGWIQIV